MTLLLGEALRLAERVTALHEEALYSLDEQDPSYAALRAETAKRVLHECDLRQVVGEVERERGLVPETSAVHACNHLLHRDGRCVGCGAPEFAQRGYVRGAHASERGRVIPLRRCLP